MVDSLDGPVAASSPTGVSRFPGPRQASGRVEASRRACLAGHRKAASRLTPALRRRPHPQSAGGMLRILDTQSSTGDNPQEATRWSFRWGGLRLRRSCERNGIGRGLGPGPIGDRLNGTRWARLEPGRCREARPAIFPDWIDRLVACLQIPVEGSNSLEPCFQAERTIPMSLGAVHLRARPQERGLGGRADSEHLVYPISI